MGAVVLSILVTMTLSTARSEAHCHIFRVWRYPKPQRCFTAMALLPKSNRYAQRLNEAKPASRPPETSREQIDIPVPSLEFDACPEGGERMVGIAKLHALYDAPPAGWR